MPDAPETGRPTLVSTLAEMPDLLARLQADHRDDGRGLCTGCRTPGYGTPGERWPCTPARLARAAQEILDRQRGPE
ncbi:hypothetical protein [Pseudonocardia endophytica]|uniref:Uncharacterized protein n=1 Tax=Pseudonocardia endophytica TaxID=401976 RepID=A0A4R1HVH4_PSEEN|nr:hypothetical protein [Pseudonocardia endophytica]TCK24995.1 hypothetical protein EV378_0792 [Pseudonocardia endophytica]